MAWSEWKNFNSLKFFKSFNGDCEINCKTLNNYQQLTVDDFYLIPKSIESKINQTYPNLGVGTGSSNTSITKSYDQTTGKLIIKASGKVIQSNASNFNYATFIIIGDVYLK